MKCFPIYDEGKPIQEAKGRDLQRAVETGEPESVIVIESKDSEATGTR